ncbi:hypothetical protein [Nocardia testacea]|uniref:Uncharacterized protein n=1 Tax=Nocardia testacea TaxID=248551 RepID=A0ABW7VYR2_9NOCA
MDDARLLDKLSAALLLQLALAEARARDSRHSAVYGPQPEISRACPAPAEGR